MAIALPDTGVIIGFLDADDAFHETAMQQLSERLTQRDQLIASTITYAELLTGVALQHHAATAVRGFFQDIIHRLIDVDAAIAERAAELRGENKGRPRMPDAITIATAELAGADVVLTTDDEWPKLELRCDVHLLRP